MALPSKHWVKSVWYIVVSVINRLFPQRDFNVWVTLKWKGPFKNNDFFKLCNWSSELVLMFLKMLNEIKYFAIVVFGLQVDGLNHIDSDHTLLWDAVGQLYELTRRRGHPWVIWQWVHLKGALKTINQTKSFILHNQEQKKPKVWLKYH